MIFILNNSGKVITTFSSKGTTNKTTPYFDDKHIIDLSTGAETFTFSVFADTREAYQVQLGNFVAFKVDDGYKLFQISEIIEEHDDEFIKTAYCEMAGIELINEIVRATNMPSASIKQALTYALQDTEYEVGKISGALSQVHSIEVKEPTKVYNFLQNYIVGTFGAEISFRVEIEGGRIVGKYVDCYAERGSFSGVRFEYGKNVGKVKKTADFTELATALVCVGSKGTTIASEEAEDKPRGQDWIGNEEAYQLYNRNGSHIFDVFKFQTESPAELLREARKELEKRCKPKLKYEVDVELLGTELNIGDTVYIIDNEFNPPLHLSARVTKIEKHRTDWRKDKVVLANFKEVVSRITDEDRNLASIIDSKFPIGSSDIQNGAVTGEKIPDNAIQGNHVVKDSITTEHLQANSITAEKIEAGQIKAEHILADQIKTEHLKANSIDAEKIQANAITTEHLQAGLITSDKIQADAIETDHIKAGQVVSEHILADQIQSNHIKANAITSEKINAGAITTEKLEAEAITSDKIGANQITTNHLQAGLITSDKVQAGSIETEHIKANAITSDKIISNSIKSEHIQAGAINTNHLQAGLITSDKIEAGSITSNHIGANQITANHIQTGSIDATKVTTGELITEKAQIKEGLISSAHIGNAQITNAHIGKGAIGQAQIIEGSIVSAHIGKGEIKTANIGEAQIESAHIKELTAGKITSGTLNTGRITISGVNGNLKIKDNRLQVFDRSEVPVERVSLGDVDGDGTKYGLRVRGADGSTILYDENGVYSEGITDGAITNPKIEDNAIDSRTLNLEELFVEDSAFINELNAVKIKASQLEVDEIRNDLINISGLVSFDSLNPELSDLLFIKDADKTYINGNTILTNTIKASQIDLYDGLTVQKDGKETLTVSTDGSVKVSGTIESFNFSNEAGNERGYRLTPEGDAFLNNATVRGSVILPSAGITNAEGTPTGTVRFWAGASFEEREEAPFRVYDNGKIVATEGEFGGTFTGELKIGNILIKDTNNSQAVLSIKTNDDVKEVVRITDSSARFDVDFSIGNLFKANVQTKEIDFGDNASLDLNINNKDFLELNKSVGNAYYPLVIRGRSGGIHKFRTDLNYGGLVLESSGTRATAGTESPYDFKFTRASSNEAVNVVIKGRLVVDEKITMNDNNKIELVSISGDNSGIDFMIR